MCILYDLVLCEMNVAKLQNTAISLLIIVVWEPNDKKLGLNFYVYARVKAIVYVLLQVFR